MNRFSLIIGLGSLLVFGAGGMLLVEWVQDKSFVEILHKGWSIPLQLAIGSLAGMASGAVALWIISRKFFRSHKRFYYKLIASKLNLNIPVIAFLSLCAGIGEELFFRAGMQPVFGVWITSIVFVALHGYLDLRDKSIAVYGILWCL